MSETTTRSVESHINIRAVHAITPVVESENVMVLAPDFRSRDFYRRPFIISLKLIKIVNIPADQRST